MTTTAGRPLQGRRILVTRPRAQAAELTRLLEAQRRDGDAPTVRIDPGGLDAARRGGPLLDGFRCLIFTSVNGVAAFRERSAMPGGAPFGSRTRSWSPSGRRPPGASSGGAPGGLVPGSSRPRGGRGPPRGSPTATPLLVRAAEARTCCRELAAAGARVTIAPAYRTALTREGAERASRSSRPADRCRHVHEFVDGPRVRRPRRAGQRGPDLVTWSWRIGDHGRDGCGHGLRVSVMPHGYTVPALAERSPATSRHRLPRRCGGDPGPGGDTHDSTPVPSAPTA
jgi:hypothetical protein